MDHAEGDRMINEGERGGCGQCVECKVLRELLLHTDQLMPPLEIGFERFEENIYVQIFGD